jgi:hypothetical protein
MPPRLLALAPCLLLAACASHAPRAPVQVTAVVVEFQEEASWSDFFDGSARVEHASRLRIVAPAELCGARLEMLHGELPDEASPWRQVGGRVHVTVSPEEVAGLRAEADALRGEGQAETSPTDCDDLASPGPAPATPA